MVAGGGVGGARAPRAGSGVNGALLPDTAGLFQEMQILEDIGENLEVNHDKKP